MSELLRKRERRAGKRADPTGLLWLPPTTIVFCAGVFLLPRAASLWANASIWACYGSAWVVTVCFVERFVERARQRRTGPSAAAAGVRRPLRAWQSAMMFTVFMAAGQLRPSGSEILYVCVAAGLLIGVVNGIAAALWRRREAVRRQQELARLTRQF